MRRCALFRNGLFGLAVFLGMIGSLSAQDRIGNFTIRFEPTARLQTGVEIPFHIRIMDDLDKPLPDAKVTLTIETANNEDLKVYKAPAIDEGVYVAKPVFNTPGIWEVRIDVRRNDLISSKSEEFSIAKSTEP